MPRTQHLVHLTADERATLTRLVSRGRASARTILHAQILLRADRSTGERRRLDTEIAAEVGVSARTVARVRAKHCVAGLSAALERKKPTRVYRRKLDGAQEAVLVELSCRTPPGGREHWTVRLLSERLVALGVVEEIGASPVWRTLKKTNASPG